MNKAFTRAAVAAVILPAALVLAGCSGDMSDAYKDKDTTAASTKITQPTRFKIEQLATGKFFNLDNGLYKLTVPKDVAGTKNDLTCLVGAQSANYQSGLATMSCDWGSANGVTARAPQP